MRKRFSLSKVLVSLLTRRLSRRCATKTNTAKLEHIDLQFANFCALTVAQHLAVKTKLKLKDATTKTVTKK